MEDFRLNHSLKEATATIDDLVKELKRLTTIVEAGDNLAEAAIDAIGTDKEGIWGFQPECDGYAEDLHKTWEAYQATKSGEKI